MSEPQYTSLHNHTYYSMLDALSRPLELARRAKELGMTALAITDHGIMAGIPDFVTACQQVGIKPIIGIEAYTVPDHTVHENFTTPSGKTVRGGYHLVLLAKNLQGYKNLIALNNIAYSKGYHYRPRIDFELLKQYHEGLICTSACVSSELVQHAMGTSRGGDPKAVAGKHKELFGGDYYIEVMDTDMKSNLQRDINRRFIPLGKSMGIKVIPTCDSHYILDKSNTVHDVVICIGRRQVLDKGGGGYDGLYHLRSAQETLRVFPAELLSNTMEIAEKIEDFSIFDERIKLPEIANADAKLRSLVEQRLQELNLFDAVYLERLEHELRVILSKKFASYFLTTKEITDMVRKMDCPMGCRGSAGGSLICYLLGITDFDPIEHGLLFERFISESRPDYPDIDIDVPQQRRQTIIDHILAKYGSDKVAHIITTQTLRVKALLKDACRALDIDYPISNKLSSLVPYDATRYEQMMTDSKHQPTRLYLEIKKLSRGDLLLAAIEHMLDAPRHPGTHASGIIISSEPVADNLPIIIDKEGRSVSQYSMHHIAKFGFLKFDLLGLQKLDIISQAAQDAGIDLKQIPLDDAKTYQLIGDGQVIGVFQLEGSKKYIDMCKQMKPVNMKEITHLVALFRPGVMDAGQHTQYLNRRAGTEQVTYPYPTMESTLKESYGICLFQEDAMRLAVEYAGYTLVEAEDLRKAIGKKDAKLMDHHKGIFHDKATALGRTDIEDVWKLVASGARYYWNHAHAVAYGFVTYACAYLSANYPLQFFRNLISMSSEEDKAKYLSEALSRDLRVLPPDVNHSKAEVSIENGTIRLGLLSMKGIGEATAKKIIQGRPYKVIAQLQEVVANRKIMANLYAAHAVDSIPDAQSSPPLIQTDELSVLGVTLGGMLSTYKDVVDKVRATPVKKLSDKTPLANVVAQVSKIHETNDRNKQKMAFITVFDVHGPMFDLIVFAKAYGRFKPKKGQVYAMSVAPLSGGAFHVVAAMTMDEVRQAKVNA